MSVLGDEDARRACLDGLTSAHGVLQREVGRQLRMKRTPTLTFALDETALHRRPGRGAARRGDAARRPRGRRAMSSTTARRHARRRCSTRCAAASASSCSPTSTPTATRSARSSACTGVLTALGKDSTMFVCADEFPLPYEYRWFDLSGVVSTVPADIEERTIVFLDCGNIDRNPVEAFRSPAATILNIDHHHDNTRFGTVNLVVEDASCTAEIVWDLMRDLGVTATPEIARGAVRRPDHRHRPVHVREHRAGSAPHGGRPDRGRRRRRRRLPARVRGLARAEAAAVRACALARRAPRRRRAHDDAS